MTVQYAVTTTTTEKYDNNKNAGNGGYLTVAELNKLIAEGKPVRSHTTWGKIVSTLDDAKTLLRAAELGTTHYDPIMVDDDEVNTRIVVRKIVEIKEVA